MTDRELLEAAAKKAGYAVHEYCELSGGQPYLWVSDQAGGSFTWSGLCDDGDALRLAVRLNIRVGPASKLANGPTLVQATLNTGAWDTGPLFFNEPADADPYAATRRAIVRAAAALADSSPLPSTTP